MPKLPGIIIFKQSRHSKRLASVIVRQGKHVVMSNGTRFLTIPRNNPINAYTMAGIVKDTGLTIEQF